jgi:protein-S-isoprenylcysteine O-methyltransferase Ste14
MSDPLWYVPVLKIAFFVGGSIPLVLISRASLKAPGSHGFFRFFAWEAILALVMLNLDRWFVDPFSWNQLISWLLLLISLYLVYQGVRLLKEGGQPETQRADTALFDFEKTTKLVTTGVYCFIRHPLYSSLLFLAWGAFFKDLSWFSSVMVCLSTLFLVLTARADEAECIRYFGSDYLEYRKHTKLFIPFLF